MRKPAMMKKMMLKKEKRFSSTIFFTVLVGDSGGMLTWPAWIRLRTWSVVRPTGPWRDGPAGGFSDGIGMPPISGRFGKRNTGGLGHMARQASGPCNQR